ncbi:DUF1700 domain-containing protein [Bacillus timonensis]|nr:DUF1700 domain-containing protein [Bacillus timonensis]
MIQSKREFLNQLERELPVQIDKESILYDYSQHFEEELARGRSERDIIASLGNPTEIANQYRTMTVIPKRFTRRFFILSNCFFFLLGILLTIGYNVYGGPMFSTLWSLFTSVPFLIVFCYSCFWVFIGYEIGKEYGLSGKRVFSTTVLIGLLPNLILMFMTLFEVVSIDWFNPLLTPSFISICVVMTCLLYPLSKFGFQFGVKQSI